MRSKTETLALGSSAPAFSLGAANREGEFDLEHLIAHGPVVLEFLRGTW